MNRCKNKNTPNYLPTDYSIQKNNILILLRLKTKLFTYHSGTDVLFPSLILDDRKSLVDIFGEIVLHEHNVFDSVSVHYRSILPGILCSCHDKSHLDMYRTDTVFVIYYRMDSNVLVYIGRLLDCLYFVRVGSRIRQSSFHLAFSNHVRHRTVLPHSPNNPLVSCCRCYQNMFQACT